MSSSPSLSRRAVLSGLAGVAGSSMLMSCSTRGGKPGTSPERGAGNGLLPNHIPFEGASPDLPSSALGVTAGFFTYPNPPVDRPGFPLPATRPVTALLQGVAPSVSPSSNPVYRRFRDRAGNELEATTVASTDYVSRFQVAVAGGELPDLVQIVPVAQLPQLLDRHFTDLTDVLGGDGVAKYPALASFTEDNWAVSSLNGRLWGIPQPRPPAGRIMLTRGDLLAARGIDANPTVSDGQEFVALLGELTDKSRNVFAIAGDPTGMLLRAVREMTGAPNVWAEIDGTFVHEIEAEETITALEETRKIIDAGYVHPQAFANPGGNHTWFVAGVTPLLIQAFPVWGNYARANPDFQVGHVRLPAWSGGSTAAIHASLAGYGGYIGIRKQEDPERLAEILRIIDYIASPFGTTQYLDIAYGVEGITYTMGNGEPTLIEGKSTETLAGWQYCGAGMQNVLYAPGGRDLVQRQHDYLSSVLPGARRDASIGLHSAIALARANTWSKRRADCERSILLGEKPVSSWTEFAKSWRDDVGAAMADEYQQAAAER